MQESPAPILTHRTSRAYTERMNINIARLRLGAATQKRWTWEEIAQAANVAPRTLLAIRRNQSGVTVTSLLAVESVFARAGVGDWTAHEYVEAIPRG
jgi:transcriptional regulator with XRE-family HTH domain